MESDESIDLVDSDMDRLLLKKNTKILVSITNKVKMLLLSFINFFKLRFAILVK